MEHGMTRRELLKDTAMIGAAVSAMRAVDTAGAAEAVKGKLPTIKLGTLEVSRLLLGSNPFFGFAHKPGDVGRQMRQYYTSQRVMAVLDAAAEQGVTAVWTPHYSHWIELWKKYQDQGGKLRIWIGQPDAKPEEMKAAITACAKNGAKAVCIQGERIDQQFRAGRIDVVRGWLEHIKGLHLPAGIASHKPHTHLLAEEKKLPADFYHQCFFQPENYSTKLRDLAVATVRKLAKPVVGYKVLAAGRLPAAEALAFAFKHIRRKDGICVGVFPPQKADQIAENAALVRRLTDPAPRKA